MEPERSPRKNEFDNPYAPPESAFVKEGRRAVGAGVPFTVADVFNWSWSIYKENFGQCLAISLGAIGIGQLLGIALSALLAAVAAATRDQTLVLLVRIVVTFLSLVASVWLGVGQTMAYLKLARGEPVEFAEIFRGGQYVLTTILAYLVIVIMVAVPVFLAVFLITFAIVAAGNNVLVTVLVFLAVAVPTGLFIVYVTSRLTLFYYVIVDQNTGVFDAFRETWKLSGGAVGTIVLVLFVQLAILLAGFLAFCVGLVFAYPLAMMLMPVTYLALIGTKPGQPPPPDYYSEEEF
jgi:hypothetical protein